MTLGTDDHEPHRRTPEDFGLAPSPSQNINLSSDF